MNEMAPLSVVWSDFQRYYEHIVNNADDASQLIGDMQRMKMDPPAMVEFYEPHSGKALSIGVGRTDTVVTFQESLDPPYYISLGHLRGDGITSFCYGNEETEYMNQNLVPFALGLDALISFVLNRQRPSNIEWERL